MGVKGLLIYLRERDATIVQNFELSELRGYRIAVDNAVLTYQYKSQYISQESAKLNLFKENVDYAKATEYMIKRILEFVSQILIAGVCPVMVFDGKAPALKNATKKDRIAKSDKKKHRIEHLKRLGLALCENPAHPITEEDIAFLRSFKKPITTVGDIEKRLQIETNGFVLITDEDRRQLQVILTAMGVPWLIAESEAEKTCSIMARRRDVVAVYTTDSDSLMYGCPIMINEIRYRTSARIASPPTCQCYSFDNVLRVMDMTESQFLEFCVISGTDFNPNPPGFGPASIYDLLKYFGSLKNIIKAQAVLRQAKAVTPWLKYNKIEKLVDKFDATVLNYDEVRCFLTWPVTYDLKLLNIVQQEYSVAEASLIGTFGADTFKGIQDVVSKIIQRLKLIVLKPTNKNEKPLTQATIILPSN
jgi:flap endonuclease-1